MGRHEKKLQSVLRNRPFKLDNKWKGTPGVTIFAYKNFFPEEEKNSPKSVSDSSQHGNQSVRTYSFSWRSKALGLWKIIRHSSYLSNHNLKNGKKVVRI